MSRKPSGGRVNLGKQVERLEWRAVPDGHFKVLESLLQLAPLCYEQPDLGCASSRT
jgi:hypothetical protein